MAIKFTMTGDTAMKRQIQHLIAETPVAARRAMKDVANAKLLLAQERVPVESGDLRDSGRVAVSLKKKAGNENISASIMFGGGDVKYAWKVHEDLTAGHPNGGQAKYLESVIHEAAATVGQDLAHEIDLKRIAMAAK